MQGPIGSVEDAMRLHWFPATCAVCGGDGVTTARDVGASWSERGVVHTDPGICRAILDRKRREIEALLEEAKAKL